MSKHKGDQGEYEFTRAAYDELAEAQVEFGVKFRIDLSMTKQRGVWSLAIIAEMPEPGSVVGIVGRYEATWPNATAVSYGAFLYASAHRLVRMLEAHQRATEAVTAEREASERRQGR